MTWYYNNDGVADGPHEDEAMSELKSQKRLNAQTLIWHPEAAQWQAVAQMSPAWWQPAQPKVTSPQVSTDKTLKKEEVIKGGFTPMAPIASEKASTTNFFKRLLGLGRKKMPLK